MPFSISFSIIQICNYLFLSKKSGSFKKNGFPNVTSRKFTPCFFHFYPNKYQEFYLTCHHNINSILFQSPGIFGRSHSFKNSRTFFKELMSICLLAFWLAAANRKCQLQIEQCIVSRQRKEAVQESLFLSFPEY